jgi:hypothetical protein
MGQPAIGDQESGRAERVFPHPQQQGCGAPGICLSHICQNRADMGNRRSAIRKADAQSASSHIPNSRDVGHPEFVYPTSAKTGQTWATGDQRSGKRTRRARLPTSPTAGMWGTRNLFIPHLPKPGRHGQQAIGDQESGRAERVFPHPQQQGCGAPGLPVAIRICV